MKSWRFFSITLIGLAVLAVLGAGPAMAVPLADPSGWPTVLDPLSELAKLIASDGGTEDSFGSSVAVAGDTIVVGAWEKDTASGSKSGAVYVFEKPSGGWSGTLTEDDFLVANARGQRPGSVVENGAAFVFPTAENIFADGFESGDISAWSSTVP